MATRGNIFKTAPIITPSRSWFDMSFDNTFDCNFGELIPTACMECLPGDVLHIKSSKFARLAPMLSPVMGKVNLFSYKFFVRARDIWENYDEFITNNDQSLTWEQQRQFIAPAMPTFNVKKLVYGTAANIAVRSFTTVSGITYTSIFNPTWQYAYVLFIGMDRLSDDGSNRYSLTSYVMAYNDLSLIPMDSFDISLAFIYRPNKDDYIDPSNYANGADNLCINPVSSGTLLDYLGVDIKGMYCNQVDWYNSWLSQCYNNAGFNLELLKTFLYPEDQINIKDVLNYESGVPYGSIRSSDDIFDFIDSHAILGMIYRTNKENYTSYQISIDKSVVAYGNSNDNFSLDFLPDWFDSSENEKISDLPVRAYNFIYNEYFRDQNYIPINEFTNFAADGERLGNYPDFTYDHKKYIEEYYSLRYKAWEHDPYTTALPGPQRGEAVKFLSNANLSLGKEIDSMGAYLGKLNFNYSDELGITVGPSGDIATQSPSQFQLSIDLSAATIENFRWANAMQKYLEKKARTGGRYYEYLLGIWNQEVSDAKLNRPIYLGGDKTPVQISEVLQTSSTDTATNQPLGDMAGRAVAVGQDDYIDFTAPDYGFYVEIVCVVPRVSYIGGLSPKFTRKNYLDYPLPDFAQLGEEYVKRSELWFTGNDEDDVPFGYQSRYYQWKYNRDEVHGSFKTSLDFWNFARKFDEPPVMGKEFIEAKLDYRQFAVTSPQYSHVYCSVWNDIQVNRALPEYGMPVL